MSRKITWLTRAQKYRWLGLRKPQTAIFWSGGNWNIWINVKKKLQELVGAHITLSRDVITHCHVTPSHTVTWRHHRLSHDTVALSRDVITYCHMTPSHCHVTSSHTVTQHHHTVTGNYHTLSHDTVTWHHHTTHTVTWHLHTSMPGCVTHLPTSMPGSVTQLHTSRTSIFYTHMFNNFIYRIKSVGALSEKHSKCDVH